jgi:hypothetical protein
MFVPDLYAGVEDRNPYTTHRIDRIDLGTLVAITERAGKSEVCLIVATTPGEWDDMLDLQAGHHEVLRAEAIATAVTCGAANAEFNIGRDVSAVHGINSAVAANHWIILLCHLSTRTLWSFR